VRDGEIVNVEVTALTAPEFSEKTALNALQEKRKQLAKGSPAVIFCIFPDAWWYPVDLITPRLEEICRRFFGSTERVNALVILDQDPIKWDHAVGAGSMPYLQFPFFNARARHPIKDNKFLRGRGEMTPEILAALKSGQPSELLRKHFRDSEFYHWVDCLAP
jgi:hypothetical protein